MEGERVFCLALNVSLGTPLVILIFIVVSLVISRRRLQRQVARLQRIINVRRAQKTETPVKTTTTRSINTTPSPHTTNTNNYVSGTVVLDRLDNNCDDEYIITLSECSDVKGTLFYEHFDGNKETTMSACVDYIDPITADAFDYSHYDDSKSTIHGTLPKVHTVLTKQAKPARKVSVRPLNSTKPSTRLSTHITNISTHVTYIPTNAPNTPLYTKKETAPTVNCLVPSKRRDEHVNSNTPYNCLYHTDDSEHVYGHVK